MKVLARLTLVVCLLAGLCLAGGAPVPDSPNANEEVERVATTGRYGGSLKQPLRQQ